MTYYTLLICVSLLLFNLIILNIVWRALKGPNRLPELSAAVVSFIFIAIGVVVTFTALSTTVDAAKLTHPIPGNISYTTTGKSYKHAYKRGYHRPCYSTSCSRRKHSSHYPQKNNGWHSIKRTPFRK